MNKKNYLYIIVLFIAAFLVGIFAYTFAYIGKGTVSGNTNVSATINGTGYGFSYTGSSSLSLAINATDGSLSPSQSNNNYSNYIESSTATTTISLTSNATTAPNGILCTYSLIYTPSTSYAASSGSVANNLRELVLVGSNGTYSFEKSIAGSSATTLFTTSIGTTSSSSSASTTWSYKLRFYNLNVDQESALGQVPAGTISVSGAQCEARSS